MQSELHQALLSCGYRYTKAQHIPSGTPLRAYDDAKGFYVKSYGTPSGEFDVALSFTADPYIALPMAYVLNSPDQYKGRLLPHINMGWYLCYVEEMEADWDANDLRGLYFQVDAQIQLTLEAAVASAVKGAPDDQEMEGEFSSYWLPDKTIYVLSEAAEKKPLECLVAIGTTSVSTHGSASKEEWIAYEKGDVNERAQWLALRGLTRRDEKTFLTSYFKIKPSRLAGVLWPPQNLRAVLQWLTEVDPSARARILDHFVNNPVKRHVLLLDVHHQDMVGLYVELDLAATGLNTYSSTKNRKKATGRVVKHGTLLSCLSSKRSVKKFIRLGVTRADRKTILSRNRQRTAIGDLSTKRIALIGCGTVGGYLASLLLRSGAGCGSEKFDLYDHDSFGPHNFGRHPLSTTDFGQNKAVAIATTLKMSTHLNCKVEGHPTRFSIHTELLKQYDIVIDSTGRPPVSKRLAHVVRTMSDKRPILVHGFNDGNGRSSKVIVDDGSCCFGCLLADRAFYKNGVDIRFKDIDNNNERHISCGSTYTPYDAAVSVITASLMQEAVLYSLEPKLRWTYSEHMLDGSRSRQPRQLPRQPNCDICHGQH
ncbi:E2/UBC family protein [Pseudomonas arcuscaelestis]|uniref:E2/UBC family protein n=1 Tax=Pseudomonas arcuscaelestis TaxID=2710591 RepID=UPI00193E4246|nr:E2/UBC family protein [Pseudomonas arcuscaelestis]MBM3111661.1 ThiF family adenylyltransferase [Pseudomonas arcuscaelestis]